MSSERDLFQAILENPEDIALRLIYADWCDERGDPRGEFIRIQCQLSGHNGPPSIVRALREREQELLANFRQTWDDEIRERLFSTPLRERVHRRRGLIRRWKYRRGFVEYVVIEAEAFLNYPDLLFQLGPIRQLRILRPAEQIRAIGRSPHLRRLSTLELSLPHLPYQEASRQIAAEFSDVHDHVRVMPAQYPQRSIPKTARRLTASDETWTVVGLFAAVLLSVIAMNAIVSLVLVPLFEFILMKL